MFREKGFPALGTNIKCCIIWQPSPFLFLMILGKVIRPRILSAKADLNSVGGIIETMVLNVPAGIGSPYFDSVEKRETPWNFRLPVKGSRVWRWLWRSLRYKADDDLYDASRQVKAYHNHNGGITGGIFNGMPMLFRVAL